MHISELDYELPAGRIATAPAEPRDSARLMVVQRRTGHIAHHQVHELPDLGLVKAGDLLVFNRSKVIPARFLGRRGQTQGKVEGLYLHTPDPSRPQEVAVLLEARGSLRPGERIILGDAAELELMQRGKGGQWLARLHAQLPMLELLEAIGLTPLPPYIRKERKAQHLPELGAQDTQRYNTVYAAEPGSVAAPTAGLHFTPELLSRLGAQGVGCAWVTLHVGAGTFAPVRSEVLQDHAMHAEWFSVPPETMRALAETRARGGRIIPVGTTSVRALESLPPGMSPSPDLPSALELPSAPDVSSASELAPPPESPPGTRGGAGDFRGYAGWTRLFIYPSDEAPFTFRFTDGLMTNFHLPRSTLLALVAALPGVGIERLLKWYGCAVAQGYRFYSYGDAMWLV